MKFEPIDNVMLNAFEQDCAASQDRDRRSNQPGQSMTVMKYFGQTIARLREAEELLYALNMSLTAEFLKEELETGIVAVERAVTEDAAIRTAPMETTEVTAIGVAAFTSGFCVALEAIKKAYVIRHKPNLNPQGLS